MVSISTAGDVDTQSRLTTFPIVIALKAQPPGGWVNVPAQAEIVLSATVDSIVIPEHCVRTDPSGRSMVSVRQNNDRPLALGGSGRRPERQDPDPHRDSRRASRSSAGAADGTRLAQSVIARNIISEAVASLRGRRLQVALSSFGIATGIAAVVLLVSIVSGMHRYAIEQFSAVGGNIIRVTVNPERSTRDPRGFTATMRPSDVDAVMASVPHYDAAMADNSGFGVLRTSKRSSQGANIRGITPSGFELLAVQSERGRLFLPHEYEMGTRVAVLGADVATDLFSGDSAVGQTIVIGEWPYLVVGVLDWVGDPDAGDASSEDRIRVRAVQGLRGDVPRNENANSLYFRLKDGEDPAAAVIATAHGARRPAQATRRDHRHLQRHQQHRTHGRAEPGAECDQDGRRPGRRHRAVRRRGGRGQRAARLRTRAAAEIGTRRAVGATRRAIFVGFLFEALAMTLSGGTVGIVCRLGADKDRDSDPVGARRRPAAYFSRDRTDGARAVDGGRAGGGRLAGQARRRGVSRRSTARRLITCRSPCR